MSIFAWFKKTVKQDSVAANASQKWSTSTRSISKAELERQAKVFVDRYGKMIEKLSHE